ncbi:MAG: hypothetical protein CMJ32_04440 [Phycisphaerae bacterium]|nr:hypothetical protein [Phycisphaerae bacterium]
MKVKGIPFWEQHIEKFVFGAVVLVLLAVVVMQFMSPNMVKLGSEEVGLGDVDDKLVEKANRINSGLKTTNPELRASVMEQLPGWKATFQQGLGQGVSPSGSLTRTMPIVAGALMPSGVGGEALFNVPTIPVPRMHAVVQTADAIDSSIVDDDPMLSSHTPESTSSLVDITWATPVTVIDVDGLRDSLADSRTDGDLEYRAVPANWYNNGVHIVDVVFERQSRDDTGRWSAPVVIQPVGPGLNYRDQLSADSIDSALRDEIFFTLAKPSQQRELLQPPFYQSHNDNFKGSRAGFAVSASDEASRIPQECQELLEEQKARQAKIDDLAERLEELGGPVRDDESDPDDGRGGSSGGGLGGGGLGGGGFSGKKSTGGKSTDGKNFNARKNLTKRLQNENEKLQETLDSIAQNCPMLLEESVEEVQIVDLATVDQIEAWCHDVTIEPDKSYRYRSRVRIYNPFFARETQLSAEQADLSDQFVLESVASEWSVPISITPDMSLFVGSASPEGGKLGMGRATIEIFRLKEGERIRESFSVQPGDRIGAGQGNGGGAGDFLTDWYVVDIIRDPADTSSNNPVGIVVLGNVNDPGQRQIRYPARDKASQARQDLIEDMDEQGS